MVAATLSTGLYYGFDTPVFGLAVAITMIVTYDAAGVRRQAGVQAEKINQLFTELFAGEPLSGETLKEVIGHTPRQVFAGIILGLLIGWILWLLW
jgi:acid phosphatase family membrane protein YuiD